MSEPITFELKVFNDRSGMKKIMKRRDPKSPWRAFGTRRYYTNHEAEESLDRIVNQYSVTYKKA